jgi:tRNA (guanine37-N1)-methyltransferase
MTQGVDPVRADPLLRIDVVTIFPDYLGPLELSLIGKARRTGLLDLTVHDLRDFTHDRHRTVDDAPAGGGAGMVMRPEPWSEALAAVLAAGRSVRIDAGVDPDISTRTGSGAATVPTLIVPSPSGAPFTQAMARELATSGWLAFACGRYEGIDERVLDEAATVMPVRAVSLGDYVLNGGEVAVLAIVEAVARLIPGVVGNAESLVEESHEDGLLEYPVYTRPASWHGREVPPVLLSGHHAQIGRWRRDESLRRTARRRPDLLAGLDPSSCDRADLAILAAEGWEPDGARFRPVAAPVAD